jgi:2-polyprenyl-3-methyl-5-hydroxy-6-metoxy-1,4-benzoquinol methylase
MSEVKGGFRSHEGSAKLGAKRFHKDAGRLEVILQREREEAKFVDPSTGLLKKELAEFRNCPNCDADNYHESFVKQGFSYCLCQQCELLYVNPMLKVDLNDEMYNSGEFEGQSLAQYLNPLNREFDAPKFNRALDLLESKCNSNGGRILDIGSAAGHFLELAKERGWQCTGIELGSKAADYSENLGLTIIREPLHSDLFPPQSFDVVSMWDLFEHLPYPNQALQDIKKMLSPEGIVAMIVPNSGSLAARIMRERCNMFIGSKHLNMFNHKNLESMLSKHGFEVLHMESLIGEVNAINNYLQYEDPYQGNSTNRESVMGLISEQTLHQNMLGYKLFCLARLR